MKNRCKHQVHRSAPPVEHNFTGEMIEQDPYVESTYELLATGVDRCRLCGHLHYYTNIWRRFYEERIECYGGTHANYDLLQLKRVGAPVTEADGRLQPIHIKAGTVQGTTSFFRKLFMKFLEKGYDVSSHGIAFCVDRGNGKPRFLIIPSEKDDVITWTVYVPRTMKSEHIIEIREVTFDGHLFN